MDQEKVTYKPSSNLVHSRTRFFFVFSRTELSALAVLLHLTLRTEPPEGGVGSVQARRGGTQPRVFPRQNIRRRPPLPVALRLQGMKSPVESYDSLVAGMRKIRTSGPTPAPGRPPSLWTKGDHRVTLSYSIRYLITSAGAPGLMAEPTPAGPWAR